MMTQRDPKMKRGFSGKSKFPQQKIHRWRKLLIRGLARRPGGRLILSIWSNGRDTQSKMPVGKMKLPSRGKIGAGAHGQESMNFFQGECDAGALLASVQRQ